MEAHFLETGIKFDPQVSTEAHNWHENMFYFYETKIYELSLKSMSWN